MIADMDSVIFSMTKTSTNNGCRMNGINITNAAPLWRGGKWKRQAKCILLTTCGHSSRLIYFLINIEKFFLRTRLSCSGEWLSRGEIEIISQDQVMYHIPFILILIIIVLYKRFCGYDFVIKASAKSRHSFSIRSGLTEYQSVSIREPSSRKSSIIDNDQCPLRN